MPTEFTDEQNAKRILSRLQKLAVLQRRTWNLADRIIHSIPVDPGEEEDGLRDELSDLLTDVHVHRRNVTINDAIRVVHGAHDTARAHALQQLIDSIGQSRAAGTDHSI